VKNLLNPAFFRQNWRCSTGIFFDPSRWQLAKAVGLDCSLLTRLLAVAEDMLKARQFRTGALAPR
jgi:hypothetical protein